MSLPLYGKKILVTREEKQAKPFSQKILDYGGIPVEVPLLKILCKEEEKTHRILKQIASYQWIFFTSSNGVDCFFSLLTKYKIDSSIMNETNIAVVGEKTGDAIKKYGVESNFKPSVYNAEVMAEEFLKSIQSFEPLLIIRGNRSRDVLPNRFRQLNIDFHTLEVYETHYNYEIEGHLNRILSENIFDFITFTSPSTVDAFIEMSKQTNNAESNIVCIGTTTEDRARNMGFVNIMAPDQFTIDGMVSCMANYKREDN